MKQNAPALPEYRAISGSNTAILDAEYEPQAAHVPLSHYLWILRRHGWKIAGFVAAVVIATLIVSLRLTPIYESTITIDIDRQMPTGVLGQEAVQNATNDADQFLATQVKLIQSDSVLRPVVDKYRLRDVEKDALEEAIDKSPTSIEAPVVLKHLKVTRPPNTYLLLISYRSANRQLAADVANEIALSYLAHTYRIRYKATAGLSEFMERQLEELHAKMEKSSAALVQFERELNVINPEEKTNITSARLLQLNTEYTNAQADRVKKEAAYASVKDGTLAAAQVSTQGEALKKLTESLNDAEQKFAEAKNHYGVNHPEFKKAQSRVQELETQMAATRASIAQRVEIEYHESVNREKMLEAAVQETKAEFDRLNSRSFEYQTLKREAEGDKKLYEELIRKIKEAGINASFQNSMIRVADPARPGLKPVFPITWLNVLLAFLFATFFGVGAAVLNDVLDNTIRDPDQVARWLNTDVIGSLPAVKDWRRRLSPIHHSASQGPAGSRNGHIAKIAPSNGTALVHVNGKSVADPSEQALSNYEEAIRTLRNSILLTDFDRRLRSVLLTSASPSEGKSTVAAHLAATHASQHKRTLLIDGDLRRPSVHRLFQVPNSMGLSNVLMKEISWLDAVVPMDVPDGLHILPAGPSTRRASDLIGMGLAELIEEATREYDLVVLDAPPLLGFAEPLQMATAVDGVIVVARAGDTSRKALSSVITTLARLRANLVGVVLNEVHREVSAGYYYYYGHYGKYYGRKE
ncbi:MAG TPA: polysaccharide biosynthesis tyrosine autokinase [Bryobacteraceae bacterium]|jgi:succinoglycan biosynthesis transport protein ExoP|nr:polysaccharide biosynthesis tyrosine autokinase [Bryobacteraceae bacterium]